MKNICLLLCFCYGMANTGLAQNMEGQLEAKQAIVALVAQYAEAREQRDSVLLKQILVAEVDQLVSSGTWRTGIGESIAGMMQSSASRPGTRTLTVEKIRFLTPESGIADARYEIQNTDGSIRKMWSTFIVVYESGRWKIAAIRNMLPAKRK